MKKKISKILNYDLVIIIAGCQRIQIKLHTFKRVLYASLSISAINIWVNIFLIFLKIAENFEIFSSIRSLIKRTFTKYLVRYKLGFYEKNSKISDVWPKTATVKGLIGKKLLPNNDLTDS